MLEFVGGTVVFVVAAGALLGIGTLIVQGLVYLVPAFRRVRFADREVARATPVMLRWFGLAGGRRIRIRSRQRRAGWRSNYAKMLAVTTLIGILPLVGVTVMAYAVAPAPNERRETWGELALFFGTPVATGYALLRLTRTFRRLRQDRRRLRAATAAEARATDPRAPIVLLRAFRDDAREVELFEPTLPVTLEEALVERLARHGPVVAVGVPGEPQPPVGASREYVSGDWRARVAQLIDEAGVIVVLLDRTPGLLWEIEAAFARRRDPRLVVIVPNEAITELETRWRAVAGIVQRCRPDLDRGQLSIAMNDTIAVVFDAGGCPRRIIGRGRSRPYYRDAVESAMWLLGRESQTRPITGAG